MSKARAGSMIEHSACCRLFVDHADREEAWVGGADAGGTAGHDLGQIHQLVPADAFAGYQHRDARWIGNDWLGSDAADGGR